MMTLKKCTECGVIKPVKDFGNLTQSKDGKRPQCKECIRKRRVKDKELINARNRRNYDKLKNKRLPIIISTHCKVCGTCKICKPVDDFNKRINGHLGKEGSCRECQLKVRNIWRKNNKDKERTYNEKYRNSNKRKSYIEKYRADNKEKLKEYSINRYRDNHDLMLKRHAEYRKNNRAKIRERNKTWAQNNKEKTYAHIKNRRKSDPLFKLKLNMRGFVKRVLESTNTQKSNRTANLLGYNNKDLIKHFSTGEYTYQDYMRGGFHIDHIIPLSYFINNIKNINDVEQVNACIRKANSMENLRIITTKDNFVKSDRICIPLINKYKLHHLLT